MRFQPIVLVCLAFTIASAAAAQSPHYRYPYQDQPHRSSNSNKDHFPYWYLGVNAQLSYVPDADFDSQTLAFNEVGFETGYGLGLSIGYRPYERFGGLRNTRFELEYTYRDVEVDALTGTGGALANPDADVVSHNLMMNAFYDFANTTNWTPYIGAGVGIAFLDFNSPTLGVDDADEVFAYQGMVGVTYSPESLPDTEWGIGYRYFAAQDPELVTAAGDQFEHEFDAHNFEVNARFRF